MSAHGDAVTECGARPNAWPAAPAPIEPADTFVDEVGTAEADTVPGVAVVEPLLSMERREHIMRDMQACFIEATSMVIGKRNLATNTTAKGLTFFRFKRVLPLWHDP